MPIGIAALAAAAVAAAAEPPPPLTIEDARTLPADVLTEIAVRQIAGEVRSVTRPTYVSPRVADQPLHHLEFALPARSSHYTGLCQATVVLIEFFDQFGAGASERDRSVRARDVTTEVRYKVIGEVAPQHVSPAPELQRQQPRCREERQVIPPEDRTLGHRAFFRFRGDLGVAYSVAILQRLLRTARDGTYVDHGCVGWQRCADSGELLRTLSFDDLRSIDVARDAADRNRYWLNASFLVSGDDSSIVSNEVRVDVEMAGYPLAIERLGWTSISRSALVRD